MNLDKRKLHRLFQLEIHHLKLLNRYSSLESQVHMLTHLWFMDYLNEVMAYLANRKLVLEVGCGGGYFANLLQQAGYDVLAGDIIDPKTPPGQFWKLQRLKLEVVPDFIRFDGRAIPFRNNTFDGVITIAVLEYVERDEVMFLHEISRVCRPGASFLFTSF